MTGLTAVETAAAKVWLDPVGAFHPTAEDGAPEGCATLVLLGPKEPGFWRHITAEPEFRDGAPDPVDRWSTRVIGQLAAEFGAEAIFPFGGPPWHPFIGWAKRCGWVWASPVSLLVQEKAGLMVSFRGALALAERLDLPSPPEAAPCVTCAAPCRTACPVGALGPDGYDTAACHAYLDTPAGANCLTRGCAARRVCPVSQSYGRDPAQSAYHMARLHR